MRVPPPQKDPPERIHVAPLYLLPCTFREFAGSYDPSACPPRLLTSTRQLSASWYSPMCIFATALLLSNRGDAWHADADADVSRGDGLTEAPEEEGGAGGRAGGQAGVAQQVRMSA